jgi:hypothetical protein
MVSTAGYLKAPLLLYQSMAYLTPGIRFLVAAGAGYTSVPVLGGIAIQRFILKFYDVYVPTWAIVTASVLAIPVSAFVSVFWKQIKDRRDAEARARAHCSWFRKSKGESWETLISFRR